MSLGRKALICGARNDRQQLPQPCVPLCSCNAKLGHMRPQGIDHLGPLPHQKIARPMQHQLALLLGRFDLHKTHGWAAHRLADRLSVSSIVLVALDVGLHIPRRHQTNLVTKLREFTRPIMSGRACLHANKARRQRLEELQHLAAPKCFRTTTFSAASIPEHETRFWRYPNRSW